MAVIADNPTLNDTAADDVADHQTHLAVGSSAPGRSRPTVAKWLPSEGLRWH
jgi:hypothetical protein